VGQLQHGLAIGGRQNFTYGVDYFFTDPRTEGTISGIYEDEDQTTEVGGYLQSQTALTPQFDLVLAGRVDTHSALPDAIFSPRAALVFKPTQDQAFRATYNRAFSTPTSLNQFLDTLRAYLLSLMADPQFATIPVIALDPLTSNAQLFDPRRSATSTASTSPRRRRSSSATRASSAGD
jgi:outer membrane receptor protein involved in Fe transport